MNIFIFQNIDQVSGHFHTGGSLAVIAKDKEHVEELILEEEHIEITDNDWDRVITYELKNEEEPRIFVFPDAGCCG